MVQPVGAVERRITSKQKLRNKLSQFGCSICGWNEASCDLHRIICGKDGGKYKTSNLIVLCPNCHRLVHFGKISLSV